MAVCWRAPRSNRCPASLIYTCYSETRSIINLLGRWKNVLFLTDLFQRRKSIMDLLSLKHNWFGKKNHTHTRNKWCSCRLTLPEQVCHSIWSRQFKLCRVFIRIVLGNLHQRCPHSEPGFCCCTWRSGMISFDLTGNQEKGLERQRVEKLGQTTQWMMMTGLHTSVSVCLTGRISKRPHALFCTFTLVGRWNLWSWHGMKWSVFSRSIFTLFFAALLHLLKWLSLQFMHHSKKWWLFLGMEII